MWTSKDGSVQVVVGERVHGWELSCRKGYRNALNETCVINNLESEIFALGGNDDICCKRVKIPAKQQYTWNMSQLPDFIQMIYLLFHVLKKQCVLVLNWLHKLVLN